jgi:hypothetical protein
MLFTKQHLDKMRCSQPGCTDCDHELFFSQKCHPKAGLTVSYDKSSGHLHLACRKCETPLAGILVADTGFACSGLVN